MANLKAADQFAYLCSSEQKLSDGEKEFEVTLTFSGDSRNSDIAQPSHHTGARVTIPSANLLEITVEDEGDNSKVAKSVNHTISERKAPVIGLLIITSMLGVLIRIWLTYLITYPGTPVFPLLGPQFLGCNMLSIDGAIGYYPISSLDLAKIVSYNNIDKKGLTTGLCGSITTFSSWNVAIIQSLLNYRGLQHGAIDNPISALSHFAITLGMSVSGLKFGENLADFFVPTKSKQNKTENTKIVYTITPAKFNLNRLNLVDWICVILGLGSLIAVIMISAFWHHYRQILLATVFAPFGTLIRWQLARLNMVTLSFPLGTYAANISGTFILALLFMLGNGEMSSILGCDLISAISVGFCGIGCLTTVSTFAAEITTLSNQNAYRYAIISMITAQLSMLLVIGIYDWTIKLEPTCG
ncbi:8166_t:CDS:2 [Ambispora gerdemannii]|uniref:8166_t:CDS:1 n=1 Tax=Ambispora gerdemannii TaxID=144530 RepID=A0A9N9CAQ5_9GLOM|nr:8166_t:CDS:2 [Ambispora gerdemannii]